MDHLPGANALHSRDEFSLKNAVVSKLILRHMDHDYADLKLGEILLMLDSVVNRHKHIKIALGGG